MDYVIVIPARFSSERLPGKMLRDIAGKPLLQHTWERAQAASAREVIIATDDERIQSCAMEFGAQVVMTSRDHVSGSDRISECARLMSWPEDQIVVNLQGDEPLMPASCLRQVADLLKRHPEASAATLYCEIDSPADLADPNIVKVVKGIGAQALLFSRAAVPHARGYRSTEDAQKAGVKWLRHLGIYAYRRRALTWFSETPPTPLETTEKLEQLRFLEHGQKMVLSRAEDSIPPGVDTAEDLERVTDTLRAQSRSTGG